MLGNDTVLAAAAETGPRVVVVIIIVEKISHVKLETGPRRVQVVWFEQCLEAGLLFRHSVLVVTIRSRCVVVDWSMALADMITVASEPRFVGI